MSTIFYVEVSQYGYNQVVEVEVMNYHKDMVKIKVKFVFAQNQRSTPKIKTEEEDQN